MFKSKHLSVRIWVTLEPAKYLLSYSLLFKPEWSTEHSQSDILKFEACTDQRLLSVLL